MIFRSRFAIGGMGFIFAAPALVFSACLLNNPIDDGRIWMSIAPIQCLGNPWEQDWLASHDNDYQAYPRDLSKPGLEEEEKAIVRSYYLRQGVTIESIATEKWNGAVCLACSCAQGYTLFVRIAESDEVTMTSFGYERSDRPD